MAKLSAAQVRCPKCGHGKNGGHNGRYCARVIRCAHNYDYNACGCRYDGRAALAEAEAKQ